MLSSIRLIPTCTKASKWWQSFTRKLRPILMILSQIVMTKMSPFQIYYTINCQQFVFKMTFSTFIS